MLVLYCCRNYHLVSLLLLIVFTLALAFAEKLSRSFYKGRASTGNTMNVTSEHWTRANKLREPNLAKLTTQPVFFLKSYALLTGLKKLEKLSLRVGFGRSMVSSLYSSLLHHCLCRQSTLHCKIQQKSLDEFQMEKQPRAAI